MRSEKELGMPSGPAHWHEHWGDCSVALRYLERRGFKDDRGCIRDPDVEGFEPDNLDFAAIDYLCQEWDFGYQPRGSVR
jgi:hypothetical protein